jgi:hypothetical protein
MSHGGSFLSDLSDRLRKRRAKGHHPVTPGDGKGGRGMAAYFIAS